MGKLDDDFQAFLAAASQARITGNEFPEQHVLNSIPYMQRGVEFARAAAERGDIEAVVGMWVLLRECLKKEVEWLTLKQAVLRMKAELPAEPMPPTIPPAA